MSKPYVIHWIGGNCPVQAEGTVPDRNAEGPEPAADPETTVPSPWYFRARGEHWRLAISRRGDFFDHPDWAYGERYGKGPFDAGWMPEDEALMFIDKAMGLYLAGKDGAGE